MDKVIFLKYGLCARHAECHILFIIMLNVVMLTVIILSVVAPTGPRPEWHTQSCPISCICPILTPKKLFNAKSVRATHTLPLNDRYSVSIKPVYIGEVKSDYTRNNASNSDMR